MCLLLVYRNIIFCYVDWAFWDLTELTWKFYVLGVCFLCVLWDFLCRTSCHLQKEAILLLPFWYLSFLLFSFLLCWLKFPVLCWIEWWGLGSLLGSDVRGHIFSRSPHSIMIFAGFLWWSLSNWESFSEGFYRKVFIGIEYCQMLSPTMIDIILSCFFFNL